MLMCYRRYEKAMTAATLSSMPGFEWCIRPACKSGQIHDEGDAAPIFTCQACGHKHCTECKRDWHPGSSCENLRRKLLEAEEEALAAERRLQEEAASQIEVQRVAKVCPQCGVNIQKSTGCDHMTCEL